MTSSDAYRDLGGLQHEFDHDIQRQNMEYVLAAEGFDEEDKVRLLEPFSRLNVGLQTPEWMTSPYFGEGLRNTAYNQVVHVAYAAEYAQLYGVINKKYQLAYHVEDVARAEALKGLLSMFRVPQDVFAVDKDQPPILVQAATEAVTMYGRKNERSDTRRAKALERVINLGLQGNVACIVSDEGVPRLSVLTEIDRHNRSAHVALKIGRGALLRTARSESA